MGGRPRPERQMEGFRAALEEGNLFYLRWKVNKYTWNNKREDETFTKERLDRVVANSIWTQMFNEYCVEVLPGRSSDHRSLLLSIRRRGEIRWRKRKVFRYEASWDKEEGCVEVVREAWQNRQRAMNDPKIKRKLENCKEALKKCSSQINSDRTKKLKRKLSY